MRHDHIHALIHESLGDFLQVGEVAQGIPDFQVHVDPLLQPVVLQRLDESFAGLIGRFRLDDLKIPDGVLTTRLSAFRQAARARRGSRTGPSSESSSISVT